MSTCPMRLSYVWGHVSQTHTDTHMHQNAKWYNILRVIKITQTKMATAIRILKRAASCPAQRCLQKNRYRVLQYNFLSAVERAWQMLVCRTKHRSMEGIVGTGAPAQCSHIALQVYADAEETCPLHTLSVCLFSKAKLYKTSPAQCSPIAPITFHIELSLKGFFCIWPSSIAHISNHRHHRQ